MLEGEVRFLIYLRGEDFMSAVYEVHVKIDSCESFCII